MVLIINQRTGGHAGAIARADCWESAGGKTPTYTVVTPTEVERRTAGKQVVIAIHGFNVSRPDAVRAYISLERQLALTADQVFFGVAWPGDGGVGNGRWKKSVDYMSRALKGDEPTRWE